MSEPIRGRIFDIRRFSVHDGQGIRTTVFLKGCPLRCAWCQNPEGIDPGAPRLLYFAEPCLHCGLCLGIEQGAMSEQGGRLILDEARVTQAAVYEKVCPVGALRLDSREYTVTEVMAEVLKDQAFFAHGGGVTLSGGEPLYQSAFARELLQHLRAAGIHTAVESSLQVATAYLQEVLPLIDTLFADCKIFDAVRHEAAVGVAPTLIRSNMEMVLQSRYRTRVTVRTPLIPGYTADRENIAAIAGWISSLYPAVKYELLNFNPLAKAKYVHVDFAYAFSENPPPYTKAQLRVFRDWALAAGCRNVIVEI